MLDDLAVLVEAEDVDARVLLVARPGLTAVQDDIVALRECSFELDALARVLTRIRSKCSTNGSLPSATCGLCWM